MIDVLNWIFEGPTHYIGVMILLFCVGNVYVSVKGGE